MIQAKQMTVQRGRILAVCVLAGILILTAVLGVQRSMASSQQVTADHSDGSVQLNRIGSYLGHGAEIAAYDPGSERLFVVDGTETIQVLDISDPAMPNLYKTFSVGALGDSANSVAVSGGYVAVAVQAFPKQEPGTIGFYDIEGSFVVSVTVGALPDMVTFTPDDMKVIVANEGEPDDDYLVDPEGSVSVIDVSGGVPAITQGDVTNIGFNDFNVGGSRHDELPDGVRIYGPGATVAEDLEPEYVAVSADSLTAWVTLQENNGLAVIDLSDNTITAIKALGSKDYTLLENQMDASDADGGINIRSWPVNGLYMPDAIASFEIDGMTYLLTANEGDSRDYAGYSEEGRVKDITLDPNVFSAQEADFLQMEANLGRLKITTASGQNEMDEFSELFSYGGRSFSIWSADGSLVYDSGSDIGRITAAFAPPLFNSQGDAASFDARSDDKGAEPEGVTKGVIDGRTYAFIGLERNGGIMVYDVTDPNAPVFIEYIQPGLGDVSPEGLLFIAAENSPSGKNLLVVTYEVSGTTTIFEIEPVPQLGAVGMFEGEGAEIAAYDPASERLFIASGDETIQVVDISDPAKPSLYTTFSITDLGAGANSVAVSNGYVAVAVQADPSQEPGTIGFYDIEGSFVVSVTVGALPDMVTFTPDGMKVIVANEGEPDDDYLVDPQGSVSVIDVSGGVPAVTLGDVTHIGFADFNVGGSRHDELPDGVRIYGPGATVAEDLEPEYAAVSADSMTAWVTLQENNGLAVIDLSDNRITAIKALGSKDYTLLENQLDASDQDGGINIHRWPVNGLYMPDAIASFEIDGMTYLLTANEGDSRDYGGYSEEERVKDVTLDPNLFTMEDADFLQMEANLGRLKITAASGQNELDEFSELFGYGGRSFSIWSADGTLVNDSGSQIAAVTAVSSPTTFNSQGDPFSFDDRSDDKGAEPEGVTKGVVNGRTYAFVGLERIGGIVVYDVTDPNAPRFIQYQAPLEDDTSPEGLLFIPAKESPTGDNYLVVTYEVSGTMTIFKFAGGPELSLVYLPVTAMD